MTYPWLDLSQTELWDGNPLREHRADLPKLEFSQSRLVTEERLHLLTVASVVQQQHIQQRAVNLHAAVVFDESQFTEFVHEETDARARRAHHGRQRFLTHFRNR